jgi:hypothetical protein
VREETGYELQHFTLRLREFDEQEQGERYIYVGTITAKRHKLTLGEGQALEFIPLSMAHRMNLGPYTKRYLSLL